MDQADEVREWIQTEVLPNIVKSGKQDLIVPQILSEDGHESFKVVDISISSIGTDEAFMLTNCYRIKVVYMDKRAEKTLFLIAKKTPHFSVETYDAINFDSLFRNEIAAYTKIIPTLLQFSKPGLEELIFPKYYYSNLTANEASIVLGNFETDGWRMANSYVNLSLDHILLAVQQIGVLHGLCYALKATARDNFDALIGLIKESRYARPPLPQWEKMSELSMKRLRKAVDKFCPQISLNFFEKLEQLLSSHFSYSKKRIQPIEPYATLCHGDFLRNNIAFKYNNEDPDVPIAAMMFDFQTLRYSSPMLDVCVLLSLSTGKDVRSLHFNKIFDAYHRKLTSTFVNHTEMEVPKFLSKTSPLKEYAQYLPFALGIASFFLATLHEPDGMPPEERIAMEANFDWLEQDALYRGGDKVDAEIAALVDELCKLSVQEDVDIFKNFI